jgi:hypothetical protein
MVDPVTLARFERYVDRRGPDECWPWMGPRSRKGYGLFQVNKQRLKATHVSLLASGEERRDGKPFALHSCDNPPCVNPAHLRWGSKSDNMRDASARGRHHQKRRTHCHRGHPLAEGNLTRRRERPGWRECLACHRESARQWSLRFAAKANAAGMSVREYRRTLLTPNQRGDNG